MPQGNEVMQAIEAKLARGEVVILDGTTGTELQRRGAPMDDAAWCAVATMTHGDLLRGIHADYIRAGADIVTTNTFSSARHMLEGAGHGDRTPEFHRRAAEIAREAVAQAAGGRPVAVAGSISTMRPIMKGVDRRDPAFVLPPERMAANYREAALALAEAGVDLLLLEMICDLERGEMALEAARATGLPVWVGMSAQRREPGPLMSFHEDGPSFQALVEHHAARPVGALGVMHSSLDDTEEALPMLLERATMPVMVYPESGYFRSPDWEFVHVEPDSFAEAGARWVARGARIVGGCCGLGPEHIAALARRLRRADAHAWTAC
jgi:S-methylmethionine-dependent homocysteine/selenocysteine methylase